MTKLTPKQRSALAFLGAHGPVGTIPVNIGMNSIHALVSNGLATEAGKEPGAFGFVKYALTDAGLKALEDEK